MPIEKSTKGSTCTFAGLTFVKALNPPSPSEGSVGMQPRKELRPPEHLHSGESPPPPPFF